MTSEPQILYSSFLRNIIFIFLLHSGIWKHTKSGDVVSKPRIIRSEINSVKVETVAKNFPHTSEHVKEKKSFRLKGVNSYQFRDVNKFKSTNVLQQTFTKFDRNNQENEYVSPVTETELSKSSNLFKPDLVSHSSLKTPENKKSQHQVIRDLNEFSVTLDSTRSPRINIYLPRNESKLQNEANIYKYKQSRTRTADAQFFQSIEPNRFQNARHSSSNLPSFTVQDAMVDEKQFHHNSSEKAQEKREGLRKMNSNIDSDLIPPGPFYTKYFLAQLEPEQASGFSSSKFNDFSEQFSSQEQTSKLRKYSQKLKSTITSALILPGFSYKKYFSAQKEPQLLGRAPTKFKGNNIIKQLFGRQVFGTSVIQNNETNNDNNFKNLVPPSENFNKRFTFPNKNYFKNTLQNFNSKQLVPPLLPYNESLSKSSKVFNRDLDNQKIVHSLKKTVILEWGGKSALKISHHSTGMHNAEQNKGHGNQMMKGGYNDKTNANYENKKYFIGVQNINRFNDDFFKNQKKDYFLAHKGGPQAAYLTGSIRKPEVGVKYFGQPSIPENYRDHLIGSHPISGSSYKEAQKQSDWKVQTNVSNDINIVKYTNSTISKGNGTLNKSYKKDFIRVQIFGGSVDHDSVEQEQTEFANILEMKTNSSQTSKRAVLFILMALIGLTIAILMLPCFAFIVAKKRKLNGKAKCKPFSKNLSTRFSEPCDLQETKNLQKQDEVRLERNAYLNRGCFLKSLLTPTKIIKGRNNLDYHKENKCEEYLHREPYSECDNSEITDDTSPTESNTHNYVPSNPQTYNNQFQDNNVSFEGSQVPETSTPVDRKSDKRYLNNTERLKVSDQETPKRADIFKIEPHNLNNFLKNESQENFEKVNTDRDFFKISLLNRPDFVVPDDAGKKWSTKSSIGSPWCWTLKNLKVNPPILEYDCHLSKVHSKYGVFSKRNAENIRKNEFENGNRSLKRVSPKYSYYHSARLYEYEVDPFSENSPLNDNLMNEYHYEVTRKSPKQIHKTSESHCSSKNKIGSPWHRNLINVKTRSVILYHIDKKDIDMNDDLENSKKIHGMHIESQVDVSSSQQFDEIPASVRKTSCKYNNNVSFGYAINGRTSVSENTNVIKNINPNANIARYIAYTEPENSDLSEKTQYCSSTSFYVTDTTES